MFLTTDMSEKSTDIATVVQPAINEADNQHTVRKGMLTASTPLITIIILVVLAVVFVMIMIYNILFAIGAHFPGAYELFVM